MLFLPVWLLLSAVLLALLLDRLLGEPPAAIHPVVGMGKYLNCCGQYAAPAAGSADTGSTRLRSLLLGAGFWLCGAGLVIALAFVIQSLLIFGLLQLLAITSTPAMGAGLVLAMVLIVLFLALLLKPLFAWRMLADEVAAVDAALAQSLTAGQQRLAYLVSRDTSVLHASQVREAAIETLAENFNDSVIAPLFWFCLGGLPAAALYRYANTADASWGYKGLRHGRDWTYAGRFAARADDVLSWLPARLTALIIFIASQADLAAKNPKNTLKNIGSNAVLTPSPNSGWPMAAAALALDLRLCKPGVYALNPDGKNCGAGSIAAALNLLHRCWCGLVLALGLVSATYILQNSALSLTMHIGGHIWS